MTAVPADWVADATQRTRLETTPLVARLAVLGSFDPGRNEDTAISEVLRFCGLRLHRADDREEWMLIESVRIQAFVHQLRRGGLPALAAVRRASPAHVDNPLQTMLDAWLLGAPWRPLAECSEDELAACTHVARWARSAIVLAGLPLSTYTGPDPEAIEGRLSVLEVTRPVRWLVRHPMLGRDRELAALRAYLDEPSRGALSEDPAFCLHGIGGVGKSTLVAAFVTELAECKTGPLPWAYLDFDRGSLKPEEQFTIVADLYRQIGAQYPTLSKLTDSARGDLLERQLSRGLESRDAGDSFREAVRRLAQMLVAEVPSPLVVVLDTCEEVQRAPEAIDRIYEVFDALAAAHGHLKLVVSGRGRVPQFESSRRPDRVLVVGGLDGPAAAALLQAQIDLARGDEAAALDPDFAAEVVALVGGNPLSLAVAARVLVHEGRTTIVGAVERARALGRVRDEFVRGFLYRRVLDHLKGRGGAERHTWLRSVARASLALRYVTPELIERVLKPATHVPAEISAGDLYGDLVVEVGFVEDVGDALRLREDVRGPALDALRIEDAALVQRVHDAARSFYTGHASAPHARVERLYHALALGEVSGFAGLDRETVRDLGRSVGDFPGTAAALVRRLSQDVGAGAQLARDEEQRTWELGVLSRADTALRSNDHPAARQLLFERTARSPTTELYRLESRLLEAEGDLEAAATAAGRDLGASQRVADSERLAAAAVRQAGLLERLGRGGEALEVLEAAERSPLLTGNAAIRLELVLHRMNTAERAALWSDDDRWLPGLEARRWIRVLGNRIDASPTLVRLLAAGLGRDEPGYLRRALQHVGLGVEADPRWLDDLARELIRWDAAANETLGGALGLIGPQTPHAWRDVISVLGATAGETLNKLWDAAAPPPGALEAIRMFYLWWAIPFTMAERDVQGHFLDDLPLDFNRPQLGEFEKLILTAYPRGDDLRALCHSIGLDATRFDFKRRARYIVRDVLEHVARTDHIPELVNHAFTTLSSSLASRLQTLVGADWLAAHALHTLWFLAANPVGTSPLKLQAEARGIEDELKLGRHGHRFAFVARWAAQPLDLLRDLRKLRPTVVHYSGHGDRNGLYFQSSQGDAQLVSTGALVDTFAAAGGSVRLVVLNACYTESQAEALVAHVDCVVGTLGSISDDAARSFAVGFYGALSEGESVAAAVRHAQAALVLEGLGDAGHLELKVRVGVNAEELVLTEAGRRAGR